MRMWPRHGVPPTVAAVVAVAATACAASAPRGPQPFPASASARAARPAPGAVESVADRVIGAALSLRGTPYRFGGTSPATGFDCSGLVTYVLGQQSIDMPRTVAGQFAFGAPIDREAVRPGDLVFFSTTGPGPTHVGLAIDLDGAPAFIHAPADGSRVRIDRLDAPYWRTRWIGARRVL